MSSVNTNNPSDQATGIFINYRREDTAAHAGRLHDALENRFGGRVFMDIDTIEAGQDFIEVIQNAVGDCKVLLVMIGRQWATITNSAGQRRLDDPDDFVRTEIAEALKRDIRVIPVLVEDASMPRKEELPPDLTKLLRRNAIELSDTRWAYDVGQLIKVLEKQFPGGEDKPAANNTIGKPVSKPGPPTATWKIVAVLVAVVALIALGLIGKTLFSGRKEKAQESAQEKEKSPQALGPPIIKNARIYLLSGKKDSAPDFAALQKDLITAGFDVVGAKSINDPERPDQSEIRVFNAVDKPQAEKIAEYARLKFPNSKFPVNQLQDDKAKPGYIEIWLGR
jgi:TIR domain